MQKKHGHYSEKEKTMRAIFFFHLEKTNTAKRLISLEIAKDKENRKTQQQRDPDLQNKKIEENNTNMHFFNPYNMHSSQIQPLPQNIHDLFSPLPQQQFDFKFPLNFPYMFPNSQNLYCSSQHPQFSFQNQCQKLLTTILLSRKPNFSTNVERILSTKSKSQSKFGKPKL